MRWFVRHKEKPLLESSPVPLAPAVSMEQWDRWAQELEQGVLRHDIYLARLLHLPHIFTLGWIPDGEVQPRPLPFNNHLLQTVMLPVFTGSDAVRRFAEIQHLGQPLVLELPTGTAWVRIAGMELDGVSINPGGRASLSCDMNQVLMLAQATRQ